MKKIIILLFCFVLLSSCSLQEIKDTKWLSQIENNAEKISIETKVENNKNIQKDLNDVIEVEIKWIEIKDWKQIIYYKNESYIASKDWDYKYWKDYICVYRVASSLTSWIDRTFYFYNKKTWFEITSKQIPTFYDWKSLYKYWQSCIWDIWNQKCYPLDQLLLNKDEFILIEKF